MSPPGNDLQDELETTGNRGQPLPWRPRAFVCSQCQAAFNRASHLKRHKMAHWNEKPFKCSYCSVSSTRKDVIIRHVRNKHFNLESCGDTSRGQEQSDIVDGHAVENARNELPASSLSVHPEPTDSLIASHINGLDGTENLLEPLANLTDAFNPGHVGEISPNFDHFLTAFNSFDPVMNDIFDTNMPFAEQATQPTNSRVSISSTRGTLEPFLFHTNRYDADTQNIHQSTGSSQSSPSSSSFRPILATKSDFSISDEEYAKVKASFQQSDPTQRLAPLQLPSKFMVIRSIKAFLEYFLPNAPIIHIPTFEISKVPAPLLVEIIACGTLYLSESDMAEELHVMALSMMPQADGLFNSEGKISDIDIWYVQTRLLACQFGAYSSKAALHKQALLQFSSVIHLARESVKQLKSSQADGYYGWVRQETVHRCMAYSLVLGAAFHATSPENCVGFPHLDNSFSLPADETKWNMKEEDWEGPPQGAILAFTAIREILMGQTPVNQLSEFGLLTVMAAILLHVCEFEALTKAQNPDLFRTFTAQMDQPLQVLHNLWEDHPAAEARPCSIFPPMIWCARALLNSAYYHLYGSSELKAMKMILHEPSIVQNFASIRLLCQGPQSPGFEKCLIRAAETFLYCCRIGISYLKRLAPHRSTPLAVNPAYEGCLLLCWYFVYKHLNCISSNPNSRLTTLLDEVFSELRLADNMTINDIATLPLATCAQLIGEKSVWQGPSIVANRLTELRKHLKEIK